MLSGKRVFQVILNPDKGLWTYGDADPRDPVSYVMSELDDEVDWPANACRNRMRKGDIVLLKFGSQSLGAWRGIYGVGAIERVPELRRRGWWFTYRYFKPATRRLLTHPVLEVGFKKLFDRSYGSPIQELSESRMRLCERLLSVGSGVSTEGFEEGDRHRAAHNRIERSAKLRDVAKAFWAAEAGGLRCRVCGFSFEEAYGKLGEDFIELHHIRPLALAKSPRKVKPIDLAPICANCHRMAHRRLGEPLSLKELQSTVARQRKIKRRAA